ncbi:sensor histidine kinase [Paenibacillus anaericanus]|uniref:sensor histidine kinase n=1 Tax=Paenibacillus anaericanus TaxID=170367 RepID=UPI0027D7C11B|nr:HAMP domain-containing sensor histidine kinase [Paenibacillus anaericanus]
MRINIVFKLFILTTSLCMLILATIYVGQTIFFKQYYANRKVNDIQMNIGSFKNDYLTSDGNALANQKLEQDFYRKNNTWITVLDSYGNLKNMNDFYIEVKLDDTARNLEFSNMTIKVPMYNLVKIEEVLNESQNNPNRMLSPGARVFLSEMKKDSNLIPYEVYLEDNSTFKWHNEKIAIELEKLTLKIKYNNLDIEYPGFNLSGAITEAHLPDGNEASNFIYTNSIFLDRIQEFQLNLLFDETKDNLDTLQTLDYAQGGVKYKLIIDPIKEKNGTTSYIFSMASLQPVDEAVQMLKDYYVYIVGLVMLLIILASAYYAVKIARPLLLINKTTKRMASLDFSERIKIRSKDEIGDLSQNINFLSQTLHSYIHQLQKDIEKEKQLERTRKEFISGVSHELKTPLSVMKSCISILKDGVANHKKDYYFKSMENEVDKMDILIVDMLELAKYESGTYKMNMDAFYIDTVIEQICEQLSLEIRNKELAIHIKLIPVEVIANQHRIEQVITNFITNSIRYTPQQEKIIITTIEESEQIKVCVENTGVHIPEDQLDKIWDRFYRGDTARQRAHGGTGLGLAISKNILELHGVKYGVVNTEDGVLFYFYLNKFA